MLLMAVNSAMLARDSKTEIQRKIDTKEINHWEHGEIHIFQFSQFSPCSQWFHFKKSLAHDKRIR
jgi:hypothetical protein